MQETEQNIARKSLGTNQVTHLREVLAQRGRRTPPSPGRQYAAAAVLLITASLLRWALSPLMGTHHPYLLFIPAALAAGWYGRFGPAMVVLSGGYIVGDLFFQGPPYQFGPYTPDSMVAILTYALITLIGTGIFESYHRTQERLQLSEEYGAALEKEMGERQQAEQALQESEQEYRRLFESNPLPTWVFDIESLKFLAVNEAAVRHYGYSREEFLKMSTLEIRPAEDAAALREYVKKIAVSEHLEQSGVWRHHKKDGTMIEAEITNHKLKFADRQAMLIVANDVTERRQAERELHQAQERLRKYAEDLEIRVAERTASLEASVKSLEGVLYHVAHDLRAPLRAMNGFTHLLVKNCCQEKDCQMRDFAQRIKEASELMDEKIEDLLDFGRLGHQPVTMEPVDLGALVGGVLRRMDPEIQAKKAEVKVDAPMPSVMGDPDILEQVVQNLVSNALTFVGPGDAPKIHIWAEQTEDLVCLYVEDRGIGIAPQYHEKVFGLFQKVHEPGLYPGTGMGLAIAKKGMERMGGRIGLSSEPGHGSRFWTELKAA